MARMPGVAGSGPLVRSRVDRLTADAAGPVGRPGREAGDSVAEVDVTELAPLAGRGGLHGGAGRLGLRRQRYPAVVVEVLRLGGMAGQVLRRDGLAVHRQRGGLADVSR